MTALERRICIAYGQVRTAQKAIEMAKTLLKDYPDCDINKTFEEVQSLGDLLYSKLPNYDE